MACQARRYGDQMQCGQCGLSWDVSDAERPACDPQRKASKVLPSIEGALKQCYRNLGQKDGA